MTRKNNRRDESYEPLDLTPAAPASLPPPTRPQASGFYTPPHVYREIQARETLKRQAEQRQRDARVNGGIDWGVCLVPGCGSDLSIFGRQRFATAEQRDHTVVLPLCLDHLFVAYHQAKTQQDLDSPVMVETSVKVAERKAAKELSLEEAAKKAWLSRKDGSIYYIRLNGLIKVGWSRAVGERLHSYGPQVEILVVYPGTQSDETNLHRQLKPARARGREWYEDGPILADFIAKALEQHGPPRSFDSWSRPKAVIKPRKRSA